jgi:hypothetical protein
MRLKETRSTWRSLADVLVQSQRPRRGANAARSNGCASLSKRVK